MLLHLGAGGTSGSCGNQLVPGDEGRGRRGGRGVCLLRLPLSKPSRTDAQAIPAPCHTHHHRQRHVQGPPPRQSRTLP
ncbi:hypothetical protein Micbo1qcDRAFT_167227, partial [Microdochium bolleyi]